VVILQENYILLSPKSRIRVKIGANMKQKFNGMVMRDDGFFHLRLLKATLNYVFFSECFYICTLHGCKLCSNSSDENQFQVFSHSLPGLPPGVK